MNVFVLRVEILRNLSDVPSTSTPCYLWFVQDVCRTLWCKVDNKCLTRLEAAAHGTICDENKVTSCPAEVTLGVTHTNIDLTR